MSSSEDEGFAVLEQARFKVSARGGVRAGGRVLDEDDTAEDLNDASDATVLGELQLLEASGESRVEDIRELIVVRRCAHVLLVCVGQARASRASTCRPIVGCVWPSVRAAPDSEPDHTVATKALT